MKALVSGVVNLRLGLVHDDFEISAILIFVPNAFGIFIQLGGVVGSGEDVFQEDRVRDTDGTQVLHGVAKHARLHVLVALELDLAHLNLRAFLDHKRDANCGGRNLPDLGADGGELPAVFRQKAFYRDFRLL
jgi:hypothetical protein